jgi:ADP-glucose pyrophosphorylase
MAQADCTIAGAVTLLSWCMLQNSNVGGYSSKGFVEVLAASQSPTGSRWFQGTADAVRQYLWLFEDAERNGVEDFLILSGTDAHYAIHNDMLTLASAAIATPSSINCETMSEYHLHCP